MEKMTLTATWDSECQRTETDKNTGTLLIQAKALAHTPLQKLTCSKTNNRVNQLAFKDHGVPMPTGLLLKTSPIAMVKPNIWCEVTVREMIK